MLTFTTLLHEIGYMYVYVVDIDLSREVAMYI